MGIFNHAVFPTTINGYIVQLLSQFCGSNRFLTAFLYTFAKEEHITKNAVQISSE